MNSDVRSAADEAGAQVSENRLRKEIHDIVEQSWTSLAQSLTRDFPDELDAFIRKSIDEVFARHLSGVVSPDLIEEIKSECIRRIRDFLSQALGDGLLNRHQAQLRAHIDDFLDEEFSEKLISPRRRRALDDGEFGGDRHPIPAKAPPEEAEAKEAARSTTSVGGTLAGGVPKAAAPQAPPQVTPGPSAPAPAPAPGYAPAPGQAEAARDALQVELRLGRKRCTWQKKLALTARPWLRMTSCLD